MCTKPMTERRIRREKKNNKINIQRNRIILVYTMYIGLINRKNFNPREFFFVFFFIKLHKYCSLKFKNRLSIKEEEEKKTH